MYISDRIPLLDAQSSAVSAVPAQKKPAQIGRLAADNREQFRVRATALGKRSWPGADQVAHGLIDGAIFFGSGHLLCRIEIESPLTPA